MSVIALVGASSQIAKDLILNFDRQSSNPLLLYVRDTNVTKNWMVKNNLKSKHSLHKYEEYGAIDHDLVINFVGAGDPRRVVKMGSSIFSITSKFDEMIMKYLPQNPSRRYFFLSSGAVYGSDFVEPVDANTIAQTNINKITPQDYYATAKLYAEIRHRSQSANYIVDIRVFNYFSKSQNLSSRFLITDIIRALRDNLTFTTSSENIWRDFLHPEDFFQLICCILDAAPQNCVIDCYSADPIDKMTLLKELDKMYNLNYEIITKESGPSQNAAGTKFNYYSKNFKAAEFNYKPMFSSLTGILTETSSILNRPLPKISVSL